jgi:hypothetical protein
MHNRVSAGRDGEGLGDRSESGSANLQVVNADGRLLQIELAFRIGFGGECEGGVRGFEGDLRAGEGAVLGIMHNPVHGGEDSGTRGNASGEKYCGGKKDGKSMHRKTDLAP